MGELYRKKRMKEKAEAGRMVFVSEGRMFPPPGVRAGKPDNEGINNWDGELFLRNKRGTITAR
jgi:hypothetical protein